MTAGTNEDRVIKKVLPNGLTVLFKEDHSNPVVSINVWFRIGSVNETEAQNGLAHFQEHMVFKGTERHGVGQIANLIKSAGGNLNAGTSYSYTMYYVVLPSKAFSLGLDVQADAMMNSTFAPEEFRKERLVVIGEARMYDDTPDAYTFYRTMELGFETHNYRRPIAGYEHIVSEFTRDQLVDFYNNYYRPGNAVVVVVGDVAQGEAMAEIERVYGAWPDGRVQVGDSPVEPAQKDFRFKVLRSAIDHAYFGIGFHVPSILDEDYPALEMLSTLLSSGKSSRLYRRILEEKHLATTVNADLLAEKWPGFFMVFASTPREKWAEARDAVCHELARFQREAVGEDELFKVRRQIEKAMYSELETVEGQASNLGYYEVLGDYRMAQRHRDAIRRVTPQQIMEVARRHFTLENCSLVSYLPEDASIAEPTRADVEAAIAGIFQSPQASRVDATGTQAAPVSFAETKAASPDPAGARTSNPPVSASSASDPLPAQVTPTVVAPLRLDNGVRVLVKRRTTVPMVSMLVITEGGSRLEPAGKSGLSTLGARSLLKGTKSYDGEAIARTIEGLGGSIESFSSFDVSGIYVNVLSEHIDEAVDVFKEVIWQPKFSRDKVEKEKSKLLKELARRHDHPVNFSIDSLFANAFGKHPYAHPFVGDESQIAGLTEKDCKDWCQDILVPENVVATFVGDISQEKALEVANRLLGDLKPGSALVSEFDAPELPVKPGLLTLTRNNLKQAVGLVGFLAPPMMTDEAISLTVLNGVLTGLGGRLFVELRDKRSLGYMTGSTFMPFKERSIFYGYANPGPEGVDEALDVILDELDKVTREWVRDDELNRAKQWLIGSQTMKLQRNLSQAIEYGLHEALGFGYETVDRAAELIDRVSRQDMLDAAAKVFNRDNAVLIKLLPALEEEAAK